MNKKLSGCSIRRSRNMSSDEYSVLETIAASEPGGYLATIIDVTGSAYRKEGTMMYFSGYNQERGLLSGGCVEQDIVARIESWETGIASASVNYDMRSEDDLSWGQGVGCDGSITVLMEELDDKAMNNLKIVKNWLDNGLTVEHIKVLKEDLSSQASFFMNETGERVGNWEAFDLAAFPEKRLTPKNDGGYYFRQTFRAQPRLIIYGAGPDARPVADIAKKAGFHVIVADWRPALCNNKHFPDADMLVIGNPVELMEDFQAGSMDYIVIMTHHFQKDKELLNYLLEREYAFVGILGSKKRADRLLEQKTKPLWLHSPVGLGINAEGPEQIAISIAAQLIAVKNNKVRTLGLNG